MDIRYGNNLRKHLEHTPIMPFIGVYDVFSSSIAARHYEGLFLSGFSFAASYYGLPDIGFIAWSDLVAFAQRVRMVLPAHHLLVDIDDGHGDAEVASHVVALLESVGASGVILEDQKRPRQCGHFSGKQLLELEQFLPKLKQVLATRRELMVIARTDASDHHDRMTRAQAFAEAGADAVLVEAISELDIISELKTRINCPIMVNQIAGGKSPSWSLPELQKAGVSLVNYSTPCLFAAQLAIEESMKALKNHHGLLPDAPTGTVGVEGSSKILFDNLARRKNHPTCK